MPQTNQCVADGNLPPDIYTANLATTLTYAINFEYVAEADVVVYREQPAGTYTLLTNSAATGADPPNYTINDGVDPSLVTFAEGEAPGGVSLIIGRRTDICDPLVEYQVGASIRAQDMNLSNEQLLFLIQETRSILGFMVNGNNTDPIIPGTGMDLNDLDDVDVGDPVNPDPALLRFNGTDWVGNGLMESGYTTWTADNSTFATTAAGDQRWLGGGTTPDVVGGPGVTVTPNSPAAGQILISADLEAAGAGEGGLVFDPTTGNTAEIRVNVGDGLELTADGVEVDLDGTSGLEFNGGDLRIDVNDGCEIVAAGLNAETTAASIVQTGGDNDDPAVRIATTLGDTTTNTDLVITGGTGVSVTRNSNTELTIAQTSDNNTTYDLTVPASTTDIRLAGSDGTNDDITITGGTNVTVTRTSATELDIAATDTNTTYTLPVTEDSGNAILTLTGANPASTDAVTITAGNNVTFGSFSAGGFTINASGGGSGTSGITIENDGTALTTDATTLDFTGAGVTASGTGSSKTINIPGTDTNTTYDLTVPASTTDIRLAGSDGVNDDVTITGGDNITVTRTSATELSIAGDVAAANNGQINIAGGNGLTATGDNATANQSGNTTRTLAVGAGTGITVNADDVQLAEIPNDRVLGNGSGADAAPTAVQVATNMISDDAVTYVKMQDVATANRVLGSTTADGEVSEVQISQPMINAASNAANRLLAMNANNDGMVWVDPPSSQAFASGTRMLFNQTAAPTGWTKQTGSNNVALRLVSGTVTPGGTDSFTTVFSSSKSTGETTLDAEQIASHRHLIITNAPGGPSPNSSRQYFTPQTQGQYGPFYTGYSGGGSGSASTHDHSLSNFDLSYVDVIIAEAD